MTNNLRFPERPARAMFYVDVLLCSTLVMAVLYGYKYPHPEWIIPSLMVGLAIALALAFARARR